MASSRLDKYKSTVDNALDKIQKSSQEKTLRESPYASVYEKLGFIQPLPQNNRVSQSNNESDVNRIDVKSNAEKPDLLNGITLPGELPESNKSIKQYNAAPKVVRQAETRKQESVQTATPKTELPSTTNRSVRAPDVYKYAPAYNQMQKEKEAKANGGKFGYVMESAQIGFESGLKNAKAASDSILAGLTTGIRDIFNPHKHPTLTTYKQQMEYGLEDRSTPWKSAKSRAENAMIRELDKSISEISEADNPRKKMEELRNKYSEADIGVVTQFFADFASSAGQNFPSQVANALTGGILGPMIMGTSSFSSAYQDAVDNGATKRQAIEFASKEAINQGLGDILFDQATDGVLGGVIKNLGESISKPAAKTAFDLAVDSLGEAAEEMFQSVITTANEKTTYNKDAEIDLKQVGYEGLLGGASGLFYGGIQAPSKYMAYRSDYNLVNEYSKRCLKIGDDAEADAAIKVGEAIIAKCDDTINGSGNEDEKSRARYVKRGIEETVDLVRGHRDAIIIDTQEYNSAVDDVANSPESDIVRNVVRVVDAVSEHIEPDMDAVDATISRVLGSIEDSGNKALNAITAKEKREAQINRLIYQNVLDTLRNHRTEIENIRSAEQRSSVNLLTAPAEKSTMESENGNASPANVPAAAPAPEFVAENTTTRAETNQNTDETAESADVPDSAVSPEAAAESVAETVENSVFTPAYELTHTIKKHTKTGEDLNVYKIPKSISDDDYKKLKSAMKEAGGYYSGYVKGFIVPADSVNKLPDILRKIGVGVKSEANANNTASQVVPVPAEPVPATADIESAPAITPASVTDISAAVPSPAPAVDTATAVNVSTATENANTSTEIANASTVESEMAGAKPEENAVSSKPFTDIAGWVSDRLKKRLAINFNDLQVVSNSAYGGTMAEGSYSVKDMTDALELGVNKHLIDHISRNLSDFNGDAQIARDSIDEIDEDILRRIPTQTKRSEEQIAMQQFSTPPNIAYVANWVANIDSKDTVLEPSAGIGGLASFSKAMGAKVVVNELSERRLELLKTLPFDGFYHENAEQIDNILPDSVKPTVIIMNPPFSANGRVKNNTKNAIPHIEQALARLEDGGRLVAVLGRGMADNTPTFKGWWNQLRKQYTIRANVRVDGSNYAKYGTTFDVQLVVIDKTGPQQGTTLTGEYKNLKDLPKDLEGIRNERRKATESNAPVESSGAAPEGNAGSAGSGIVRSDSGRSPSQSNAGRTEGKSGEVQEVRPEQRGGTSGGDSVEQVQPGNEVQVSDNESRSRRDTGRAGSVSTGTDTGENGVLESGDGNGRNAGQAETEVQSGTGVPGTAVSKNPEQTNAESTQTTETAKEESAPAKPKKKTAEKKEDNGVYASYQTAPLTVKNAQKHPAKLVESSAMSAVSSPKLTYKPHLDQKLIDSGALSDAQLENISYAGQAHEQKLPSGERKGYFIGDGTGVGKGRQIAGIIMDNWNQGRHRAIWLSEKSDLLEDAKRDWKDLGGNPDDIFDFSVFKKKQNAPENGILFATYDTLKSSPTDKTKSTNIDVFEKWFGKDTDGVIVYDEAHNMGNLIPVQSGRGSKKPSQKAIAGNKLQTDLANARVVYASATGATNVENLAYAARLGLWGEGTSFMNVQDFVSKIGASGLSAMELVARDMKAMGVYLARSISYDGAEFDNLTHKLTPIQREMYDTMCDGWQVVLQNFDKAMALTNSANNAEVKNRKSRIYGNMQLFFNQVLTSMEMPSVISDMEKELAKGNCCVIQLVNTNEAAQDRAISAKKEIGSDNYDDIDITPRQLLVGYVENAFPTQQYEEFIDEEGNINSRPVVDSGGNPVENKQAVKIKEELIARLNEISIPEGPLDMILNHFGPKRVAEITGRRQRIVNTVDENGNIKKTVERRDPKKSNIAETQAFMDGIKDILVFSEAGSTGRSFHASRRAKNQKRRIHYVAQAGWKAPTVIQGTGRTLRSDEVSAPVYKLVSTDIKGHKRFVTSIAKRLNSLGALTKGQRQTGSSIFSADDDLETSLSVDALREFYNRLLKNQIDGINGEKILKDMGLYEKFYDKQGNRVKEPPVASEITTFLNRILALKVSDQNDVFGAFEQIRQEYYTRAEEAGTLDKGLENVKADKIEIMQSETIYTDPNTGAETKYVKAKTFKKPEILQTVEDAQAHKLGFVGLRRMENGSVRAVYRVADETTKWGEVVKRYTLISPNTGIRSNYNEQNLKAKTTEIPKSEWNQAWKEEVANAPEYNEGEVHMITGTILPVWSKLPQNGNIKVQRIVAADGSQYLGRVIPKDSIESVLRGFDVKAQKTIYTASQLYSGVMKDGKTITMNGQYGGTLTISKRRVSGENRLEISGSNIWAIQREYPEIFSETISFQKRYFIPTGKKGEDLIKEMADRFGLRSMSADDEGNSYLLKSSRAKWGRGNGKAQVESISDLVKDAEHIFGIPINVGKVEHPGAAGIFKSHASAIRTRVYGDLPTIAHEIGHFFDKRYKFKESPYISTLTDEFGDTLSDDGYTPAQIPGESVAEYFAMYMNDREEAEKQFPTFTNWMYEQMSDLDQRKLYDYAVRTNAYHSADLNRRAEAHVRSRVDDAKFSHQAQVEVDKFVANPAKYVGNIRSKLTYELFDDLVHLRGFGGTYDKAMYSKTADTVAAGRITSAMTNGKGEVVGPSLASCLSTNGINDTNAKLFDEYLVACRALDEAELGGRRVYADEELQEVNGLLQRIETYERKNPSFKDAAEAVYQYEAQLNDLAVESGLMSRELADYLRKQRPHYVPLQRVMDDNGKGSTGNPKTGFADQSSPIKRFKGSGRDVYSPIESIMQATEKYTKACMRNDVMRSFADFIDNNEDMGWVAEAVSPSQKPDSVSTKEALDKLKTFIEDTDRLDELSAKEREELFNAVEDVVGDYITQWKVAEKQGKTTVSVMRNGEKSYYEIHDKDVLNSLASMDPKTANAVETALVRATKLFKVLTTGSNPLFGVTNVARDLQTGYISSDTTVNPAKYMAGFAKGYAAALFNTAGYQEFERNGGGYSGSLTRDYNVLKHSKTEVVKTTKKIRAIREAIVTFIPKFVDAGESASRYAEYRRARDAGIDALEAMRKSQEITVNFSRGGRVSKDIDKYVPYFNASMQSIYHLFDAFAGHDKKAAKSHWIKWFASTSVMAALVLGWRLVGAKKVCDEDDEEIQKAYNSLSNYQKNAFFSFYMGDGKFLKIPKQKDMMVMETLIERGFELGAMDDPNAFYNMGDYLFDALLPPTASDATVFGTALSIAKNETFTGSPIVSTAYQKRDKRLQYNESTSKLAIALGDLLNLSPMQIDFVLEDNTGYIGTLITNLLPNSGKANLGFLNKFTADSVYSTDIANIFYDQKDKYDTYSASYKTTNGEDERYSLSDVYGAYKYGKLADMNTNLNNFKKAEKDEDTAREMKRRMNAFLAAANENPLNELDRAVIELAETTGTAPSDIAPYVVVPETVTYGKGNNKEKYDLTFDDMITYFAESQMYLEIGYKQLMESGYDDAIVAEALKELKDEVSKEMKAVWAEKKHMETLE